MKKILFLLLMLGFNPCAFGQTPESLPLTIDQFVEKVTGAYISIYGAATPNRAGSTNLIITDATADGITRAINGTSLKLRLLDPQETVYFDVSLYDGTGSILFSGLNQFKLEKTPTGTWKLPDNYNKIQLWATQSIPVHIPGAQIATVLLFDTNGNVIGNDWLDVWSGTFYLDSRWLRENAFLSVYVDGQWIYYNLSNFKKCQATEFNIVASTSIKGIKSQSIGHVTQEIITENRVGESVIIEYKPLVSERLFVYFWTKDKNTGESTWPKGIWVRRTHGEKVYYPILIQNLMSPHIEVLINRSETIYFSPEWTPGDFIDKDAKDTSIPVGGGGPKG
jgi:hypothetical protein